MIKELISFLKNPISVNQDSFSFFLTLKKILLLSLFVFFFTLLISLIIGITDKLIYNFTDGISILSLQQKNTKILYESYGKNIYYIYILIIPFLEEIVFRLWIDLKKNHLLISFPIAAFYFYKLTLHKLDFQNVIIGVLLSISVYIISKKLISIKILCTIQEKYFKYIFFLSATIFAATHISNFSPIKYTLFFIYPIFVLPQFFGAIVLGYSRIKYGFFWCVLLHALINTPFIFYNH